MTTRPLAAVAATVAALAIAPPATATVMFGAQATSQNVVVASVADPAPVSLAAPGQTSLASPALMAVAQAGLASNSSVRVEAVESGLLQLPPAVDQLRVSVRFTLSSAFVQSFGRALVTSSFIRPDGSFLRHGFDAVRAENGVTEITRFSDAKDQTIVRKFNGNYSYKFAINPRAFESYSFFAASLCGTSGGLPGNQCFLNVSFPNGGYITPASAPAVTAMVSDVPAPAALPLVAAGLAAIAVRARLRGARSRV
jgi:hypothetical protein